MWIFFFFIFIASCNLHVYSFLSVLRLRGTLKTFCLSYSALELIWLRCFFRNSHSSLLLFSLPETMYVLLSWIIVFSFSLILITNKLSMKILHRGHVQNFLLVGVIATSSKLSAEIRRGNPWRHILNELPPSNSYFIFLKCCLFFWTQLKKNVKFPTFSLSGNRVTCCWTIDPLCFWKRLNI